MTASTEQRSGMIESRPYPKQLSRAWRLVYFVSALAMAGCGFQREKDLAAKASAEFHQRLGAGEYDAIYDDSTDRFRTVDRRTMVGYFRRINRKMGACTSFRPGAPGVLASPKTGTSITETFRTNCSNGEMRESFVWKIINDRAKLDQYAANSQLLLTD